MIDLVNQTVLRKAKSSAQVTASGVGDIIDMQGYRQALFLILAAAVTTADGSNKFTFSLEHSDDSGMSGAVAVPATQVTQRPAGGAVGAAVAVDATTDANTVIGSLVYKGIKRYVRLVFIETGTADAVFGAVALLGDAREFPAAI